MVRQNSSELRIKIEQHPIFDIPKEQRTANREMVSDLTNLVMQLKGFTRKLELRLSRIGENISEEDENELKNARYNGVKLNNKHFDAVAFMECINAAIKGYDKAENTQFMAYFDTIYARGINNASHNCMNDKIGMNVPKYRQTLLKNICQLCEKRGVTIENLPQKYYAEFAQQLGIGQLKLENALKFAAIVRNPISIDSTGDDEDQNTGIDIADTSAPNIQDKLDIDASIVQAITSFADMDAAEYPRLFFTNDTIRPMVDKISEIDQLEYCAALEKYETILWHMIFVQGYINFIFSPPPALDCSRNLIDAKMLMPMQDASIAKYKGVSKVTISKQRNKYSELQKHLKQKIA